MSTTFLLDLIWILIAAYNLLGIGIATYSTWPYISGWMIPAAALGWSLFCCALWYYARIPLWAFAILTLGTNGAVTFALVLLIPLRMGTRAKAWNCTFEGYEYFRHWPGPVTKVEKEEVIANVTFQSTIWHLLMRQNNQFLRSKFRVLDEEAGKLYRKLREGSAGASIESRTIAFESYVTATITASITRESKTAT